jgi:glutamyl-Q tRNA(Asp) synthetase
MPLYTGRFAPSPTGPLHAGSLVAALASYLDALVHGGHWLLRIDDADLTRSQIGAAECIIEQLRHYGFQWHGTPTYTQAFRNEHLHAFQRLQQGGRVYGCACTRAQLSQGTHPSNQTERPYVGHCKHLSLGLDAPHCRAARLSADTTLVHFTDRWAGEQVEDVSQSVGDFVIWRPQAVVQTAGGLYSYQFTMPCDDAAQGVTHVVRGIDLLPSTARQLTLIDSLQLPRPTYLHVPLVVMADGQKLSKQNHAPALPATDSLPELERALMHLGCPPTGAVTMNEYWRKATQAWANRLATLPV